MLNYLAFTMRGPWTIHELTILQYRKYEYYISRIKSSTKYTHYEDQWQRVTVQFLWKQRIVEREKLVAIISGLSNAEWTVRGLGHNIRGYQSERVGVQTRRT